MEDNESSVLGKRVWNDAFDQIRETMQGVFDQIIYFGINRINVANPIVNQLDIIDRLTPLEDKADIRLLKDKLSYLKALNTSNKLSIIRHEIPLLMTYLIGAYVNDMKKDNNTVLVDGIESGVKFLLWWFKQKQFTPAVIDDAFNELNNIINIFDEFQALHSYSEFNDNMQLSLYSQYIEDLKSLNQVSFTGMATRFNAIRLVAMQKKMQLHALALLCLDAVIPTLFEIFGNAPRFSTRYRLFAYIDLLIATAILAVTVPKGAYDLKEVAINAILLFPVVLKSEFAYRLLEGRGFPAITDVMPRTTFTVVEAGQMWAVSYDPMAIEFWKFVKTGIGLIVTGLVGGISAYHISAAFGEFTSVFRDARKARGVMLFVLSSAAGLAIAYETLNGPKLTDMIYAFDIKGPRLDEATNKFVEMIGGTYANLTVLTRAFVANHGSLSMHFDHSAMPFNWASMSRNKKNKTGETGSDAYAWMVPVSTKMTSVLNIMLLSMSMFGKAAILNAALPDTQLSSVKTTPINLMQQLVNEVGYISVDETYYTYNISGVNITISIDTFDTGLNVEKNPDLKQYATAIDMLKTIWRTDKTQKVDDKVFKATWNENIEALNYLNKVPIINPIVPRFIEVLNEANAKQIMRKVDMDSARIELNTNLALLYEKYGLLDKWAFRPVVLNQKYNPFQLQCLNQEVLHLRDSIILNTLEFYTMIVDYANSTEYDTWTVWAVRGAITASLTILYTLGIHRVIVKAIENALKAASKPDLNQITMIGAVSKAQIWSYQFFPVVISVNICFEMFYIATGFADETRLEFWKGFWGVKTGFGGNAAYNNGAFYRKNWDLLFWHSAFNLEYFLPRQLSTRKIINGVYIQRPQTQVKAKGR